MPPHPPHPDLPDRDALGRVWSVKKTRLFDPASLGITIVLTALAGVAFVGIGIGSLAVGAGSFSLGVGAALVIYGALVIALAWLGARRLSWAQGLIVGAALLHAVSAFSLLEAGDLPHSVGAALAGGIAATTAVTAVLPGTRRAFQEG